MIVLDVGANAGLFSQHVLSRSVEGVKVFAFEPNTELFSSSLLDLERLFPREFKYLPVALGDSTGEADFFGGNIYSGNVGSLKPLNLLGQWSRRIVIEAGNEMDKVKEPNRVKTLSIADFSELYKVREVDFLKIDIQGGDVDLLEGFIANMSINSCAIEVSASSEFSQQQYLGSDNSLQRAVTILNKSKMKIFAIHPATDGLYEFNVFAAKDLATFEKILGRLQIFSSPPFSRYTSVKGTGVPGPSLISKVRGFLIYHFLSKWTD